MVYISISEGKDVLSCASLGARASVDTHAHTRTHMHAHTHTRTHTHTHTQIIGYQDQNNEILDKLE